MGASYGIEQGWLFAAKTQDGMSALQVSEQYVQKVEEVIRNISRDTDYRGGSGEGTSDSEKGSFGYRKDEIMSSEYIIGQAVTAGFTSTVITSALQLGPEVYKAIDYLVRNGAIDTEQLKETGLHALSVSAENFLTGYIASSLTIACYTGKLGVAFKHIDAGMIGACTTIVLDTMINGYDVARGKMTTKEMSYQLSKELITAEAAFIGGAAGQTLLPELPVLGYMLGSFVGSVVASIALDFGDTTLLSFCVDTGFSFFGLVEQNYELPKEIIERLGLEVVSLDYIELNRTNLGRTSLNRTSINRTRYNTLNVMVLRRGVIGVNKVGYVSDAKL